MKGWPTKPLEEIAELYGGSTPSRDSPAFWGGDIYWVTPTDLPMPDEGISVVSKTKDRITQVGLDNSSATLVPKGTVLFSSRATIGKVAVADMPLTTNQGFANFVPHSEVTSRFLAYALWFHREDIARLSGSTTFKEVSRSTLRKYHLPVPPLAEQDRIVKLLDEADELRKLRSQAARRTADLIPALFHDMFGPDAPGSATWQTATVAELAAAHEGSIRTGPFGSDLRHAEFVEEGVPVLGIDNVVENEFRWTKSRCIPEAKFAEMKRFVVFPGDVLVTIMGTVGRCSIAPEELPVCISTKHLCTVTLDRAKAHPRFIWGSFLHDASVKQQTRLVGKGAIMEGWNSTIIKRLRLQVPPLPLQEEFAARVSEIRAMQAEQAASHRRLDDLFQSMLHRAFQGEL